MAVGSENDGQSLDHALHLRGDFVELLPTPSQESFKNAMDAILMRQWFRQLFSCPHCATPRRDRLGVRNFWWGRSASKNVLPNSNATWLPRPSLYQEDKKIEYMKYPTVDAEKLRSWKHPPKRVKMLMRDFIEGLFQDVACRIVLTSRRQSVQPQLRLFPQTSGNILPGDAL